MKSKLPAGTAALSKERLQRTARQGRRIVLGTSEMPYEPLLLGGAPLAALRQFADLEIVVTTRSSEITEELDLLTDLDVRNAVTVDFLVAPGEPGCPDLQNKVKAIARLAAAGLTTRLVATELPENHQRSTFSKATVSLRRLFETARESQVFDVAVGGETNGWNPTLRRLRMEYGFPRQLPGRG